MKKIILNYIKTLSDNEKLQELLIKTISNILLKQNNVNLFIEENNNKILHIRDWINSVINNNEQWKKPRVLTIDALNNAADKYFEKKNNKIKTIELDEKHEKLIANLGDYYIVQMITPQALDSESKIMQHCIGHGGYDQNLKNEEYQYLSLRDKYNKAHVTLEIKNKKIRQLQGKQNRIPEEKYLNLIIQWLFDKEYKIDLSNYFVVFNKNDNKIYSIYNLPENCEIDGDLDLKWSKIGELPNNLIVNGNLYLSKTHTINLDKNLTVKGNLDLSDSKIEEISGNVIVMGDFHLNDTLIKTISGKLSVDGNLDLSKCENIEKLPNNLDVKNLILYRTQIRELPNDIIIRKNLELSNSNIEKLPNNLDIKGNVLLSCCKNLIELPKGLKVKGNLYLNETNIKYLPDDLIVKGNLDLGFSKIEKLPDNFTVGKSLGLYNCRELIELPNNLRVEGDIELSSSNVRKIPDDIKIGKNLILSNSEICEIGDNIVIYGDLSINNCKNIKVLSNLNVIGRVYLYGLNLEEIKDVIVSEELIMKNINLNKISNNLEAKKISIKHSLVKLIKKDIVNFEKIIIDYGKTYSKEEFFEKYNLEEEKRIF